MDLEHRTAPLQGLSWKYRRIGLFSGMLWGELERGGLVLADGDDDPQSFEPLTHHRR